MQTFFSIKANQVLASIVLLMAIVALGAYANLTLKQAEYTWGGPTTITVNGEGEVLAVPDVGQFSFGVEAEGQDAVTAQNESATKMNAIIAHLTESGVAEVDISTQSYNLFPRYRYEERVCVAGSFCQPGEQVMDGFTVSQMVSVKVRALDTAGTLISGVGERGATNISGLTFTVDNTDTLEAEARALAITNAQAKAVELARSLGVELDEMSGFYEVEEGGIPYYGMGGEKMMAQANDMAESVPELPAGQQKTVKRVTITYQVK